MSSEAKRIFKRMHEYMRLVVPVGDVGMYLSADKRLSQAPDEPVADAVAVNELVNARLISELTKDRRYFDSRSWRTGWLEMGITPPKGAKVFAIAQ